MSYCVAQKFDKLDNGVLWYSGIGYAYTGISYVLKIMWKLLVKFS